jgi:hypothetical protein
MPVNRCAFLTRCRRRSRSSGPGIDPLNPNIDVVPSPGGNICCVTASALRRSLVWPAKVGSGKTAIADPEAKKYLLFIVNPKLEV